MRDDIVARIDDEMRAVLAAERAALAARWGEAPNDGPVAPLHNMMRYHLGWTDSDFRPVVGDGGKKVRGQLCLLACTAVGGDPERALPAAAAIELLHNFTLVHDDIQDQSETRRHRPTVWSLWGVAQAVNVGDGLYALARLALARLVERDVPAELALDLAVRFERALLSILEGQYLDLRFEADWTVSPALYQRTIEGKTARLIAFALEAGGLLGGGDAAQVAALARCGLALGLGFQARDDILSIWGEPSVTGKAVADDIRARKKSLPILLAMERASEVDRARVREMYAQASLDDGSIARVLDVLERTGARAASQTWVARFHDEALASLAEVTPDPHATAGLRALIERLVEREN